MPGWGGYGEGGFMDKRVSAIFIAVFAVAAGIAATVGVSGAAANENKRQATRAVIVGCQAVVKGDANDNPLNQGYCLGMVQAVAVMNDYAPAAKKFCPFPPSLIVKDFVGAVAANASKVSTQIYEDPVDFVTEVLRYSYPCKN
ncbi:MAG: Rap1a/Tai family immunity protein [Alphaproteobacteria bacterium]